MPASVHAHVCPQALHGAEPLQRGELAAVVGVLDPRAFPAFWKAARARFMPPLSENILPLSLCQAFALNCQQQQR